MSNILINPSSGILEFNTGSASGSAFDQSMLGASRFQFQNSGELNLTSYGTGVAEKFTIDSQSGRLFSVDTNFDSLFSANNVAGLPILEVFSDGSVIMGEYNSGDFVLTGNRVGIATASPTTELDVSGAIKGGFSISEKSADFTLGLGDNGSFFNGTSASFDQITISSDLGADFNAAVMNTGANVVITGGSSMIINGTVDGGVTLASGYQPASIVRLATNTYAVFGNLS